MKEKRGGGLLDDYYETKKEGTIHTANTYCVQRRKKGKKGVNANIKRRKGLVYKIRGSSTIGGVVTYTPFQREERYWLPWEEEGRNLSFRPRKEKRGGPVRGEGFSFSLERKVPPQIGHLRLGKEGLMGDPEEKGSSGNGKEGVPRGGRGKGKKKTYFFQGRKTPLPY